MIQEKISLFIPVYINLLIVFTGFSVPIIGLLLSFFSDGIKKLTSKYQSELEQYKESIKKQNEQLGARGKIDIKDVERNLKELKSLQRKAKRRLFYINPRNFLLQLLGSLLLAIFIIQGSFLAQSLLVFYVLIIVSLIAFGYVIYILWKLLGVLMELAELINEEKRGDYESITELISVLIKNTEETSRYFLKKVYISINSTTINDSNPQITLNDGQKEKLEVRLKNSELRMAKNVEVGFKIPLEDFIIEKSSYHSLFSDGKFNFIRFSASLVQGKTNFLFDAPLTITPLKKGKHTITTFIKAENIETIYRDLDIVVQ